MRNICQFIASRHTLIDFHRFLDTKFVKPAQQKALIVCLTISMHFTTGQKTVESFIKLLEHP